MATKPINNGASMTNPLLAPKAQASDKKKAVDGAAALDASLFKEGASAKGGAADVKISGGAKDRAAAASKAFDIAKNTPDVREDRVAALKAQIDAGTYQPDSGKIADGILREAVREHLAESQANEP